MRSRQQRYDWFGCGVWFVCGAVLSGIPWFVLHFAPETRELGTWQVMGLLVVCCLAGRLYAGRKDRRQREMEKSGISSTIIAPA